MAHQIRTICNRDCPDSCGILATVEDGRITKHGPDPEHGITQGFLCWRGNHYLERFYHRERLLHPLRRGPRGLERVSWDAALDLVAERLERARSAHGPLSALYVTYSGIHHWVARVLSRLFWAHFGGATTTRGGLSVEPCIAAQEADMGADGTHEPEDLANSAAFVVWGKNLAVTRPHCMPFVKQARDRGAPLVVIDPIRSATARMADLHLALRPGTDGLLAMGISRLLLERGAWDRELARDQSNGFDEWRQLVMSREVDQIALETDVPRSRIEAVADLYATKKPLCTMIGLGPAYHLCGGAASRLVDALAAVSGNIGLPGGGASTDLVGPPVLDLRALREAPAAAKRQLLLPRLGDEILATSEPPLEVAFVAGANPVATAPDGTRVAEGLRSIPFRVVVDQFMTATAELADVILPCTTYLEMDDVVTSYGHGWVGLTRRVVPPLGETRPDGEIMQDLARRLGFGPALEGDAEAWLGRLLGPLAAAGLGLDALRERPRRLPGRVRVPFADRRFATPSGKFEFIRSFEPDARPLGPGELFLVATKSLKMVNAQVTPDDLPAEPVARAHPDVLAARDLADGGVAVISSSAGRLSARVRADSSLRRDVVLLNPARWRGDLVGVNQLRESRVTDLGEGAAMHATRVRLAPLP
ncbi:MAG: molybdopterin-dependent oxidoreductase [Deltaproteobacteria bacterium]|nr:molybdopterin-dependent oxidoreductase [Deltaproteobacteria bacterium]